MLKNSVTLKNEDHTEVSFHDLRQVLDAPALAGLLDERLNTYENDFQLGKKVGIELLNSHRTLQGCAVRFALGILAGFATEDITYTDDRNRVAIQTAKEVDRLLREDKLKCPPFI